VENEHTSHNFSLFAIFFAKNYQNWWKFEEVLTKTILQFFLRHGVDHFSPLLTELVTSLIKNKKYNSAIQFSLHVN